MKELPAAFIEEMQELFDTAGMTAEWPAFLQSLQGEPQSGLRANTLKIEFDSLRDLIAEASKTAVESIKCVSWTNDGLYCPSDFQPGLFPGYYAGLYYIQEPSAMLPAHVLAAQPHERILDLCAAPGGKSARIAADLKHTGLLWSNEISKKRVRALQRNIELTGSPQTIISAESPQTLAGYLPGYFDAIITDVPCSGSGMFRKDSQTVKSWLSHPPHTYANLQYSILCDAWTMLKPGGRLVYSTCSFSLIENEQVIERFISSHPDGSLTEIARTEGLSPGIPVAAGLDKTVRIWPHRTQGEGHYCALLTKGEQSSSDLASYRQETVDEKAWQAFDSFCQQTLSSSGQEKIEQLMKHGHPRNERNHLHILPECPDAVKRVSKVKTGLFLGQVQPAGHQLRFNPSAALLLCLTQGDLLRTVAVEPDSDLLRRCLRGETLSVPDDCWNPDWQSGDRVAIVMRFAGGQFPVSWSRVASPRLLKNDYPKGWVLS